MIATVRRRAVFVAGLMATAAAFLLPQLWLFSLSLKNKAGLFEYPPTWVPKGGSLANYRFVLTHSQVPWYLWNSLVVAAFASAVTLAVAVPAAYVLSRDRFRGRRPLLAALLVVQMVSPVILLVPIYGIIERLGLIDTRAGLILVYARDAGAIHGLGVEEFFRRRAAGRSSKPRGWTARRAGARFWTIVLPIVAPGLGATAVFNLAAYWSEFCLALVLLDSQARYTMPLGLFSFQSGYDTDWHLLAAASFIALVPVIAVFAVLQRYFVAGLTAGAVKG